MKLYLFLRCRLSSTQPFTPPVNKYGFSPPYFFLPSLHFPFCPATISMPPPHVCPHWKEKGSGSKWKVRQQYSNQPSSRGSAAGERTLKVLCEGWGGGNGWKSGAGVVKTSPSSFHLRRVLRPPKPLKCIWRSSLPPILNILWRMSKPDILRTAWCCGKVFILSFQPFTLLSCVTNWLASQIQGVTATASNSVYFVFRDTAKQLQENTICCWASLFFILSCCCWLQCVTLTQLFSKTV